MAFRDLCNLPLPVFLPLSQAILALDHHVLDTLTSSLPHQKDKLIPNSGPLDLLFLLPGPLWS